MRAFCKTHSYFHMEKTARSESGRGLIEVQDTVETVIFGLRYYVRQIANCEKSKQRLLIATCTTADKSFQNGQ